MNELSVHKVFSLKSHHIHHISLEHEHSTRRQKLFHNQSNTINEQSEIPKKMADANANHDILDASVDTNAIQRQTKLADDNDNEMITETCESDDAESIGDDPAPAIGIDLGTTFSCVSAVIDGEPKVFEDPDTGLNLIPSCVAFTNKECLIGEFAKDQAYANAENTIFNVKRMIGVSFNDTAIQNEIRFWPFRVIDTSHGPGVAVAFKDKIKCFTVIEISAMILRRLKSIAEHHIGQPVVNAVITVPANFNNAQREATKVAGRVAGLNVMRIINEPTAAAMAYSLDRNKEEERSVCVYDLGGGTFDVTILTFKPNGAIRIRSTGGDSHLGGEDFDYLLITHVINEIKKMDSTQGIDIPVELKHKIRVAAKEAKHLLSFNDEAIIRIENIAGTTKNFVLKITKDEFEKMIEATIKNTMVTVEETIQHATELENGINDIKEVVLVGGSSRIPMIKRYLHEKFPDATVHSSKNPDTVVSIGAAIQAAITSGNRSEKLSNILLWDVTPLDLGVRTSNGYMNVVIPRHSTTPADETKMYGTDIENRKKICIDVYEGQAERAIDNNCLGSFILNDVPDGPAFVKRIAVRFFVDTSGILNVTASATGSDIAESITIEHSTGRLDEFEIQRMIENANL